VYLLPFREDECLSEDSGYPSTTEAANRNILKVLPDCIFVARRVDKHKRKIALAFGALDFVIVLPSLYAERLHRWLGSCCSLRGWN
jgi:hypothetical protein